VNPLLQSCILTNQIGVGPLNLLIRASQVSIGDPQVLDHLACLRDSSLFLLQRSLETIDVVREAARASSLRLEILEGLLRGLLRGAPSDFALHTFSLHLSIGLSGKSKVRLDEALLLVKLGSVDGP